jgi:hypothetical protein
MSLLYLILLTTTFLSRVCLDSIPCIVPHHRDVCQNHIETIEVIRSIISREFCIRGQILSYNAIISHNFILIVFLSYYIFIELDVDGYTILSFLSTIMLSDFSSRYAIL